MGSRRQVRLQAATAVRKVIRVHCRLLNAIRPMELTKIQLLCPDWPNICVPVRHLMAVLGLP